MNLRDAKLAWDEILANAEDVDYPRSLLDADIAKLKVEAEALSANEYAVFTEYSRMKSIEFFAKLGFQVSDAKPDGD